MLMQLGLSIELTEATEAAYRVGDSPGNAMLEDLLTLRRKLTCIAVGWVGRGPMLRMLRMARAVAPRLAAMCGRTSTTRQCSIASASRGRT
jgi:hypothetical protein